MTVVLLLLVDLLLVVAALAIVLALASRAPRRLPDEVEDFRLAVEDLERAVGEVFVPVLERLADQLAALAPPRRRRRR